MGRTIVIYRPIAPIWQAQFCSRGYYFAVASADKTVSLWTTDRLKPLRIFTDAQDDVTCIDFHPNCNYITGGSIDNVIRVWDVLSGTCVRSFTGHRGPIRGLKVIVAQKYSRLIKFLRPHIADDT
jgi:transcription initiation factor TFIID subunit 5